MSLADMTIVPAANAPAPAARSSEGSTPTFARPTAAPAGTMTMRDGKFSSDDGGPAPIVRREGGTGAAPPKDAGEILKRFGATWAGGGDKPADKPAGGETNHVVEVQAGGATAVAAPAEPGKEAAKPADPASAAAPDEFRSTFGERKPAEVKAEMDRYLEANRKLAADLEAARKQPAASSTKKYAGTYIDNSHDFLRQAIADELGIEDASHEDVTKELQALTLDLNAAVFGGSLDTAQQAARDAAKARQALARDKRTRTAQGDSSTSSEEAQAKKHAEFIGNRLSATRTGPDGKALPSMREQFPLAGVVAQRLGIPLEQMVLKTYLTERDTGRFDPQRLGDDDYLISESARILESQYQDLADALGKARTQSTAPQPNSPAPAPAAAASERAGQPQGHGGRTALTAADSSEAPATKPTPPPAKRPGQRLTRAEFESKWFPKS